jgi:hypothetical protein
MIYMDPVKKMRCNRLPLSGEEALELSVLYNLSRVSLAKGVVS